MITDELNINERMVHQVVTQELNIRKVCAKLVPKNLDDDKKACRNEVLAEMLEQLETDPDFRDLVITGDESCFFKYDPEANRHSVEW
jgi:hypothetical protein